VEGGATRLLVDLGAVRYLDSASIGCLMDVHRLLLERGGSLRLAGLQPVGGDHGQDDRRAEVVPLHPDEDDALSAFSALPGEG